MPILPRDGPRGRLGAVSDLPVPDASPPVPSVAGLPALPGVVVVGAAIVRAGRLLAAQRSAPPELAGCWELPGGKVDPGESPQQALARECHEELEVTVRVGERIGPALPVGTRGAVLLAYVCTLVGPAEPVRTEHAALRWLAADQLDDVPWLPADLPLVPHLRTLLS